MAVVRTVLSRTGIIKPQDGTAWSTDGDANWDNLENNFALLADLADNLYECSAGSGLTLNVAAGRLLSAGALVSYAGGTLSMTGSATNYVYLDPAASFAPAVNTSGFATGVIPLATVVCGSSAITSVTDKRPGMVVDYGAVAANKVIAGPASGADAVATARSLVAADLPVMVGDSGSGGTKGAVPAPGAGDAAGGKYLRADGTWDVPTGSAGSSGTNISRTAQTASISTTSILTPSADGLFEISVVHLVSSAGSAGTLKTEIGWTDEQGARLEVFATDLDLSDGTAQQSASRVIRAKTTAPITYKTTVTGASGAPEYDLFINVRTL